MSNQGGVAQSGDPGTLLWGGGAGRAAQAHLHCVHPVEEDFSQNKLHLLCSGVSHVLGTELWLLTTPHSPAPKEIKEACMASPEGLSW